MHLICIGFLFRFILYIPIVDELELMYLWLVDDMGRALVKFSLVIFSREAL